MTELGAVETRDVVELVLGWGRQNAQTYEALSARLGLPERDIRGAVEEMRREGVAICTATGGEHRGVWLTQDPAEVREQYRRLRRRAIHQLANLRRMLRTAEAMERPLTLWERAS